MMVSILVDIKFVPHIDGLELVEEITPKPANQFIPPHWKDIPALHQSSELLNEIDLPGKYYNQTKPMKTAKKCPSFIDVFNNGFVIPAPCDLFLQYDNEKEEWNVETGLKFSGRNPNETFEINFSVHPTQQYLDHVPNAPYEYIFKLDNLWSVITPKGYSIMQLPMFWHHNPDFEVAYGIIHTDQYHQINIQIMMRKGLKEIEIKMGEPLCYIVPYKREEYNLVLEAYDTKYHNAVNIANIGRFKNSYKTLFRKRNKQGYKE